MEYTDPEVFVAAEELSLLKDIYYASIEVLETRKSMIIKRNPVKLRNLSRLQATYEIAVRKLQTWYKNNE